MKRRILYFLSFAGLFFMLGFFWSYHRPQIKRWVLVQLEKQSTQHSPVRVWAEDAEISLFPPRLELKGIRYLPREPQLAAVLAPGEIESVQVQLSIGSLLRGQLRVSQMRVVAPQAKLVIKDDLTAVSSKPKQKVHLEVLEQAARIPIEDIVVERASVMIGLNAQKVAVRIEDLNVNIASRYRSLFAQIETPQIFIKEIGKPEGVPLEVETRFLLESDELNMTALKIRKGKSYIVAAGQVKGPVEDLEFKEADVKLRVSAFLPELQSLMKVVRPQIQLPHMEGRTNLDLAVRLLPHQLDPKIQVRLGAKDVVIDKYVVGDVSGEGMTDSKTLNAPKVTIQNSAGKLVVHDLQLGFGEKITIQGKSNIVNVELRQILSHLNVKRVPIHLDINGELPCSGEIRPKLEIQCKGSLTGDNLVVTSDLAGKDTIVALKKFAATGELKVDMEKVVYKTAIQLGTSVGSSEGSIAYDKGFNISYDTPKLEFGDVKNLANLKFEGAAKISGSTEGDSSRATINMDVAAQNFWFEDYFFGNFSSSVGYKTGVLAFRKTRGNIRNSRYDGSVQIDFPKSELSVALQTPYVEIEDITFLLSRVLPVPIHLSGTGTTEIRAQGPMQLNKMTYQVKGNFYRGDIADENFDEVRLNLTTQKGFAQIQQATLVKGASIVTASGTMDPNWKLDINVTGRGLHLEQLETVERLGINATGLLDFAMKLTGNLPRPETEIEGQLRKMVANDLAMEDSNFRMKFKKDRMEGRGNFLGQTVVAHTIWPFDDKSPFELQMKATKWDFAHLFSLASEASRQKDFETSLTGEVNLNSPQGGFWHSSGKFEIKDFFIRHGSVAIRNPSPLILSMQNGLMRTDFFKLIGDGSALNLETLSPSRGQLDMRLNGHVDLNLLNVVAPFLSDLRGQMNVSLTAKGSVDDPTIQGSGLIDRGFVRPRDFPHTFEDIHADLLLTKRTLNISSLRGVLGGGKISGEGRIGFQTLGNVPVDITGQFENVSLNIPEGFHSRNHGRLHVYGTNFPYTLAIETQVDMGEVTREFSSAPTLTKQVQPSNFLPKYLDRQAFEPFNLDLDINLKTPAVVRNSTANVGVMGQIHIVGPPKQAKITGRLQAQKGGKVFFNDTPFDLITGNVEYRGDPADNPLLYGQGRARVTENSPDNRPQTYDIDLIVQGRPKNQKDLKINLSSQPALSQQQIVSLLALGMTMSTTPTVQRTTDQQNSALATQGSVQLGTALLKKPIGNEIKSKLGVDMQISSAYNQADQTTVPKVTFSKQWTPKFIGSASRTIDKNPVNLIKLEYKMDKNLSLIGSWQGQSSDTSGTITLQQPQIDRTPSILGLDLEYKIEFK